MKKYKVIAIVGASGSGKTTLFNLFRETLTAEITNQIIQYTTRPKRDNEIQNKEYHFIKDFKDYINILKNSTILEEMFYKEWHYFSTFDDLSLNKINIGVFNPEAIITMGNNEDIDLYVFEIIADQRIRINRILTRNNKADIFEVVRRTLSDKKSIQEMREYILGSPEIFLNYQIYQNNNTKEKIDNLKKLINTIYKCQKD